MNLSNAELNCHYKIDSISEENDDIRKRLYTHGFLPGERVLVKTKAPIFKDPILVQLQGMQIALTRFEAMQIFISSVE